MADKLDPARLASLGRWLSNELDARATLAEQVAICGSVLMAAAMCLPPAERHKHLAAHLYALQRVIASVAAEAE